MRKLSGLFRYMASLGNNRQQAENMLTNSNSHFKYALHLFYLETAMEHQRKDTIRTRRHLLSAASRLFAEKGFRDSTIAEICNRAGTNVAAVNYHFGNKKNLYAESWRHSLRETLKACPADGGVSPDAPAEQRLRGRIRSLLQRITTPESHEFAIIDKELANPTGLLQEILQKEINPQREALHTIIFELLGPEATGQQIHFCQASIVGQCFHLMRVKQLLADNTNGKNGFALHDLDAFTDHIVTFSLAGIAAIRLQARAGQDNAAMVHAVDAPDENDGNGR